jgi:hypothetical protein
MKFYSNTLVGLASVSLFGRALGAADCTIVSTANGVCTSGGKTYAVHAAASVIFSGEVSTINGGDVGVAPGTSITMVKIVAQKDGIISQERDTDFSTHVLDEYAAAMLLEPKETFATTEMGGKTFTPGTYKFSSAINIALGTTVTLSGAGDYVFQASSTLTTAAETYFILENGAKSENVKWVLGTAATLGARSLVEGSILAGTDITLGAQAELRGCALAKGTVTFSTGGSVDLYSELDLDCTNQSLSQTVCQNFAVHAGTAVTFVTGDKIDGGDVGVSPAAFTSITGNADVTFENGGAFVTESDDFADSVAFSHSAAIAHRSATTDMGVTIELGGSTYTPGTYRASTAMSLTAGIVTLDGKGDSNAKFIFQAGTTLITGANTEVVLMGGAKAENVIWSLGSAATLGAGSIIQGSILAGTSITFGSLTELHGCALALAAVTFPTPASVIRATTEGGGGFGDPHFKTWLGDTYDFHGQCDMILTKSAGFGGGLGLEIQVRTEIRHDWSFIAETTVKIGNDVLEVGNHAAFHMNGVAAEQLTKSAELQELSGFPVRYFNYGSRRHKFEVDLGSKGKVVIKVYNEFLAVGLEDSDLDDFSDSVGLMGSYVNGKLVARDGHFITDSKEYGLEWQVRDTDKNLFQEAKGPQYPQQCRMPSAKAVKRRRLLESMVSYKEAEHACAGFEEEARESCIFDVLSTGDLNMADAGAM